MARQTLPATSLRPAAGQFQAGLTAIPGISRQQGEFIILVFGLPWIPHETRNSPSPSFVVKPTHRVEPQQDQEGDGGEAAPLPLLQRHSPVGVVVDLDHHVLQDLSQRRIKVQCDFRKLDVTYIPDTHISSYYR
jgi:hypothetical protein